MTTSRNGKWQLWLASFLATGVVWTYFVSRASAQNAGTITITNSNLIIGDGVSILGQSKSGSILVTPRDEIQNIGNGGNISISAESIRLVSQTEASDTSSAQNIGNAGNISLNAESILISVPKASDTSSAQNIGNAGNISINAAGIFTISDRLSIPGQSNSGSILLTPRDEIQSIGNGGNISLNAGDLLILRTKASDTSSAQNIGNGGNISINANSIRLVSVPEPSHTSGILVFAVLSVASVLKRKQKNDKASSPMIDRSCV